MFENLTARLDETFRRLRGQGKLSEANVAEALKEVRRALLEADVNFKVVKEFVNQVQGDALGQAVLKSITPGQQFVKVVHDHMVELLGTGARDLAQASKPPTRILIVGLQGSGKTTLAAKLALRYRQQGRRPLLVACDIHRPAAIDQLEVLGEEAGVAVHREPPGVAADRIAQRALEKARAESFDPVVVATAGRLHIDQEMMEEVTLVKGATKPHEVLFVADAMTGQDAVRSAKAFDEALGLDGVVLTKMDGDARGGAAISIRAVTGKPIKLIGTGEKLDALESFHPDRMASRILGKGDVLSLVEKAQGAVDEEEALRLAEKLKKESFTLDDFRTQLRAMRKMGPLDQLLGMIPGLGSKMKGISVDEKALGRIEAIINSMTPQERINPRVLNGSRRKRIARGSGTTVQEVNQLLRQFQDMKKMLKRMKNMGLGRMGLAGLPF